MEQKEHTVLTLKEAKEIIAKKYDYPSWQHVRYRATESVFESMSDEAHELSLTSQLSSALESYNRECKRNEELQCLLREILNYDYNHLQSENVSALTVDLSDKIKSALSKHQPIKKE